MTTSEVRAASPQASTDEADPPQREMVLGLRYLEALERAGAVPVVVPPLPEPAIEALLDGVAGVCLSGGPDIHPAAYGAEPHAELGPTEPALDRFELAVARAADARGLPLLAICRGAQLLNVARGGTLVQHLPDTVGDEVTHRQTAPGDEPAHDVRLAAGTRLGAILGRGPIAVNSFHHQAVRGLGHGLTAAGWAPDGTVEAFEAADRPFALAVQWHAETLAARPEQAALFAAFVAACADGERAGRGAGAAELAR